MMQHKGSLDARVSEKGWRMLDKIDRERANQAMCIAMAGRQYAVESGLLPLWYCIAVDTGREQAVEKRMLDAGIEACVPMRMGPARRVNHKVVAPSPIPALVGFVMVRCVFSGHAMRALRGFQHVNGLVGGWDGRYSISDEKMNAFMDLAKSGKLDHERPASLFNDGAGVSVKAGPFCGFVGKVVGRTRKGKGDAVVELSIFGRSSPVIIPLALLEPL